MKTIAVATLLLLAVLAACGDDRPKDVRYTESGKALAAAGNLDKAKVEFGNALQINPKNVEARYQLALIAERQSNFAGAFKLLNAVVTEKADHVEAQAKLGQMYLVSGDAKTAREKAEIVARIDPTNPQAILLDAALALSDGSFAKAAELARVAWQAAPSSPGAVLLARSLAAGGQKADALAVLDAGIARAPKDIMVRLSKVDLLLADKRLDDAIAVFRDLIQLDPQNYPYRRLLAQLYLDNNRPAEAEAVLREAIAANVGGDEPKMQLVDLLFATKGRPAAAAELLKLVEADPKARILRLRLADFSLAEGKVAEGQAMLRQIIAEDPDGPHGIAARVGLARYALVHNDAKAAEPLVAEVLQREPNNAEALLMRASMFLDKGDPQAAIVDVRTMLRDNPDSKPALRLLTQAYAAAGLRQTAEETLLRLIKLDPDDPAPRQQLATMKARGGDTKAALALLDEITKDNPGEQAAALSLQAKARLLIAEKRWDEAEATLRELGEIPDWQGRALMLTGAMQRLRENPDAAIAAFEKAYALNPDSIEAVNALVQTHVSRGKSEAAAAFLERAMQRKPDNAYLYNALGEVRVRQRDWPAAEAAFDRARALQPKWPVPYANLAQLYFDNKEPEKALAVIEAGLRESPENADLLTSRGQLEIGLGRFDAAIATFLKVIDINPGSLLAVNNAASLIADQRSTDAALLKRATELAGRLETFDDPTVQDTVGWVFYRAGDLPRARTALAKAAAGMPDQPVVQFHYGVVLAKLGETAAARQALETALKAGAFPGRAEAEAALAALPR